MAGTFTLTSRYADDAPTSLGAASWTSDATLPERLTEIWCSNNSGATRTIRVYLVPNGGAADVGNAVMYDVTLPVGLPVVVACNTALAASTGTFIHASGASVAVRMSTIRET